MRFALPLGLSVVALLAVSAPTFAAGTDARPVKDVAFSFEGPFGTYDRAALQRGFQVYKEVCSACHSLNRVSFHALADEGGPGFTEAQAKAIAASYKIPAEPNDQGQTVDENGERLTRPGILADHFPPPFPNENAARAANGGALPPDLSLATIEQEAHDVTTFLAWAAEPKMEQRKRMGFGVMAFLIVLSGLLFLSYRKVWADAH